MHGHYTYLGASTGLHGTIDIIYMLGHYHNIIITVDVPKVLGIHNFCFSVITCKIIINMYYYNKLQHLLLIFFLSTAPIEVLAVPVA